MKLNWNFFAELKFGCSYIYPQMLEAYRTFAKGEDKFRIKPRSLGDMWKDHQKMCEVNLVK